MRIAYVSAGAGGMYCGSCIHDNTLSAALIRAGHEVALLPTYTPMRTDEESVSDHRVFYGALNVYLQGRSSFFRRTPKALDWLLDRPGLLRLVARLGASTDAKDLGSMALEVLQGEGGPQAKELEKLVAWLRDEFRPEVVQITNSMFLGLVRRIRQELGVPVVVALQGEDLFLDQLPEPFHGEVIAEMRRRATDTDLFVAPSRYYAEHMAGVLGVAADRIRVVPLGIRLEGHGAPRDDGGETGDGGVEGAGRTHRHTEDRPPETAGRGATLGYLARICPEKGLHLLIDAFLELAPLPRNADLRLRIAGYIGARDRAYLEECLGKVAAAGLQDRVECLGEVDLAGKLAFLRSLDLLALPTVYRESKGLPFLEALADGVPVVVPRHGSFPELVEATGGGLLVDPDSPRSLAAGIQQLLDDPTHRAELGRRGQAVVRERFDDDTMAETMAGIYGELVAATR